MSNNFWNVFHDTGDIVCYLLCKAGEREEHTPEIIPIPDEFQMNPPRQPELPSPR